MKPELATITSSYVLLNKRSLFTTEIITKIKEVNFLKDVRICDFSQRNDYANENYDLLTNTFIDIINQHALLEKKFIKGNKAPFIIRNL